MQKFGIGQAVRRREDERFLTGQGRYLDDITLPRMTHAAFVRSSHAHARIVAIDGEAVSRMPGVLRVLTHADVERAGLGPFPTLTEIEGVEGGVRVPPRFALTGGIARHAGDPLAMVVADTAHAARAAADAVSVEYEDLPAISELDRILDPGAPVVWKEFASNLCYRYRRGDAAAVERAMADARHVTSLTLLNNRVAPCAIEPRGAIGDYDTAADRLILHVSGQGVHSLQQQIANAVFKVPPERIRVVMPDVGGGFGAKNFVYPELVMVMLAAKLLDRPVKWVGERTENFLSETHGRDHLTTARLALGRDGRFLALDVRTVANMGAYLSTYATIIPSWASWVAAGGSYAVPAMAMQVDAVFTNTVPVDAYRGAGRPESAYVIERLVDVAAMEMGIDRFELRRRNFISRFPYKAANGNLVDCGVFAETMQLALGRAQVLTFTERRERAKAQGKLRGLGVSSYLEVTLGIPNEEAEVRFDRDGGVTLLVGTAATGQGHETAFVQVVHTELGIPPEKIRYVQGDTALIASGSGHGGSRSLAIGGGAVVMTAREVKSKGLEAAAHMLEAAPGDLEFEDGSFAVKGTDRRIGILDLEAALREASDLPPGIPRTLTSKARYNVQGLSFPNGTHVCEVEVDPETGHVAVVGYAVVDDFGRIVNPLIAAGQVMGGAVQGIGQALLEGVVYDRDGQLLTGSFMDYAMPRAADLPALEVAFNENAPTATNPLGVKGAGEAGATGAPPALVNAVVDALKDYGIRHLDMPLTPEKVWRAIQSSTE